MFLLLLLCFRLGFELARGFHRRNVGAFAAFLGVPVLTFGALTHILENFRDLVLQQGLFLQQGERQAVKHIAVFHENLEGLIMSFFQKFTHLGVDLVGGRVRVVTCRRRVAAHERFGVVAAKLH